MWAILKRSDVLHRCCGVILAAELGMVRSYRGSTCSLMWAILMWSDVVQNSLLGWSWLDHTVAVHVLECEVSLSDLISGTELTVELIMVRSYRGCTCSLMWAILIVKVIWCTQFTAELSMVRSYRGCICSWMWVILKWSDVVQNSLLS